MAKTEQEILADTLKSQEQGGGVQAGGSLGAGADVPAVLEAEPDTRKLLSRWMRRNLRVGRG